MKNANVKSFNYKGYMFHIDGTVYTPYGAKVKPSKDKNGNLYTTLHFPAKYNETNPKKASIKKVYIARQLFCLYHNTKLKPSQHIWYKDGNKENLHIDNIYLISNQEYNKKHRKKSNYNIRRGKVTLTEEQKKEIRRLYKNYDKHIKSQWNKDSLSMRDLAKKYGVSLSIIQKVLTKNRGN